MGILALAGISLGKPFLSVLRQRVIAYSLLGVFYSLERIVILSTSSKVVIPLIALISPS